MSSARTGLWIRLAAVGALALGVSACDITVGAAQFKVREEKRFAVTGAARVNLSTFDGSIEVRGWDRPEVVVEVEKQAQDQAVADQIKVEARQDGSVITIDIPQPSGFGGRSWRQSPSASLTVSVPLHSDLVVRSGDGSMSVRRINGTLDLKTDDGSIRLEEITGGVLVRTRDGSVTAKELQGAVDAETGDGSITLDGIVKGVRLETEDGSIRFTARAGSVMESDWSMTTGDGSVQAELPKGFSAEVDAETGDGRVRVDGLMVPDDQRPESASDRHHERERRVARGTLGAGGKALRLRSGSGSITVQVW